MEITDMAGSMSTGTIAKKTVGGSLGKSNTPTEENRKNMKTPNWIKNAYRGTDVGWERTQGQIHKMLNELGIYDVRFTNVRERFVLEFIIPVDEGKPRAIRIICPIQSVDEEKMRQKELNIVHRMLLAHLKAKFVAIGRGLTEFEQEFMAHLVITDKHGNSKTMGEALLPQYRNSIESGENKDFTLLDEGKKE